MTQLSMDQIEKVFNYRFKEAGFDPEKLPKTEQVDEIMAKAMMECLAISQGIEVSGVSELPAHVLNLEGEK